MYGAGHPKLVLCDNLEGREGGGRGFQNGVGGHICTYGRFILMDGKNHHNIVIILQLK